MNLWGRSLITSTSFVVAFYFMNLNAHRSIDRSLHLIYAHLLMLYLFNRAVGRSVGRSVGVFVFLNGPNPASFSFIFGLFKQTIQLLQYINVKKCHVHIVYGAGIQTNDLSSMSGHP